MPRVLACDDDPLIRNLLATTLEFGGYDVVTAADGTEAIAAYMADPTYDVVVTDYNMPRANGIDVITQVHAIDPTTPCVIVTAFRDLDLAMKAMQAGAAAFIPKPFKSDHLLTIVARAYERRALEAETMRLRLLTPLLERFTMVLANTLESKDFSTQRHSERLVYLSDVIAKQLEVSQEARGSIRLGACLHDIGKIGIPEAILNKEGALTDEERSLIQRHPDIGAAILQDIDTWDDVRLVVRHHHERFDGAGYPCNLKGEKIPIGARIVAVADAFDVMIMGRPYCPPKPFEQVMNELRLLRNKQFDPGVVDAFITCLSRDGTDWESAASTNLLSTVAPPIAMHPGGAKVTARWLLSNQQTPSL